MAGGENGACPRDRRIFRDARRRSPASSRLPPSPPPGEQGPVRVTTPLSWVTPG